ncbi:hypothetical protein OQA88_8151 [Cercophora sp. LCS_1]
MNVQTTTNLKRKEGFAQLAQWITLDADNDTSIYRKFGELGARNLLYLQAELFALERDLEKIDEEDVLRFAEGDLDAKDLASTWEQLVVRFGRGDEEARRRMELILKIREKVKEYHEAVLLQNEIAKLRRPPSRTVSAYRHWFQSPHPVLGGLCKHFLDDENDLVGLGNVPDADYLSLLLRRHWPLEEELSRDGDVRIGRFNGKTIIAAVAAINTVIAAILLIGPILGLYYAQGDKSKLVMMAAFTAVFAASVGLITNARRAEIFGATAAYVPTIRER